MALKKNLNFEFWACSSSPDDRLSGRQTFSSRSEAMDGVISCIEMRFSEVWGGGGIDLVAVNDGKRATESPVPCGPIE